MRLINQSLTRFSASRENISPCLIGSNLVKAFWIFSFAIYLVGLRSVVAQSVWLEELTSPQVDQLIRSGHDTVIIPTGGVEQNGPFVALGKHNYIIEHLSQKIATKLGNALIAPVVKYVPEGSLQHPDGHMLFAGTISVKEETFQQVLKDACTSFKIHGFKNIVLFGDSGGNQAGMFKVANELNYLWSGQSSTTHVFYIPQYYNYPEIYSWLKDAGYHEISEGIHDDLTFTAQLMAINPDLVEMKTRQANGTFKLNGIDLNPPEKIIALGNKIIDMRVAKTVEAVRARIQSH